MTRSNATQGATCAKGLCTSPAQRDAPDGYHGPYGGSKVCNSCYKELVDLEDSEESSTVNALARRAQNYLAEHGHLPNESHESGWCQE